jgi:hypothetical protein
MITAGLIGEIKMSSNDHLCCDLSYFCINAERSNLLFTDLPITTESIK